MIEKNWYASKKLWVTVLTILITGLNEQFGWNIATDESLLIMGAGLIYVLIQAGLDWYERFQYGKQKPPIAYAIIREAIESIVSDLYDYAEAKNSGIQVHADHIQQQSLDQLKKVAPQHADRIANDPEVKEEILRKVMKNYNEDKSLYQGAELVKSQMSVKDSE